jgi:hypothetical protein
MSNAGKFKDPIPKVPTVRQIVNLRLEEQPQSKMNPPIYASRLRYSTK